MGLHIKRGDTVLVIAGKDKGKTGKIISCDPDSHTAKVDGVHTVTKHSKPKNRETPGGIRKLAGNIDSSNLMVVCPACGKASRVGYKTLENGKKIRYCKKCAGSMEASVKDKKDKKKKAADKAADKKAADKKAKPATAKKTKDSKESE